MLLSGIQQNESVICIHISTIFRFFSHIGHNSIGRVPCAIQFLLVTYFIYSSMSMSVTIYILKKKNIILDCSKCQTLFLGGSKITADGDCSHGIKRHLLLGRKVMA